MSYDQGQMGQKKNLTWLWVILIVVVLAAIGFFVWKYVLAPSNENSSSVNNTTQTSEKVWKEQGVAIAGQFADADVVDLGSGKYRIYYASEPESGQISTIYSATSTDGKTWAKEDGTRKEGAVFPDVIKLSDGTWRMYFQNDQEIKSATSTDGLTWTDEAGTRIDKNETGFELDSVGAQSTTILPDGSYVMLYRGTINEPYQTTEKVPNQTTQLYFYATSKDGLTFEKQGIAIDTRDDVLYGLADGADWVKWDDPSTGSGQVLRAYFWSYKGVYYTTYKDGTFSAPQFTFTNNTDTQNKFPENPPGDPTLIQIDDQWFMYYGQHTKGIYYAIYQ